MAIQTLLLSALLLSFAPSADSFSTGAGGCPPNTPAVGGFHLSNPFGVTEVSFQQASYSFQVDGNEVTGDGESSIQLVRDQTYTIAVVSDGDPFRGALIRVEGSGVVDAGDNSITASACEKGVTHSTSSLKSRLSGVYVVLDAAMAEVAFDVTVVQSNNGVDGSVYAYQRFTLPVIDPPALATPPPIAPMTNGPVQAPTLTPVVAPTLRPITASPVQAPTTEQPTNSPISSPTMVPVTNVPVTNMPSVTPTTEEPTKIPTLSPMVSLLVSPISPPVAPPVDAVVSTPVAVPVSAPVPAPTTPSPPTDPFPTVPIAWLPTTAAPVVPTTIAPIPTIPIAWLPTTAAPVKMPSMFGVPTIPIAWTPPTTESSETPLVNQTDLVQNATDLVFNMTDTNDFNETDDMVGHNSTDMDESDSSAENLESSSMRIMSWLSILLGITISLLL